MLLTEPWCCTIVFICPSENYFRPDFCFSLLNLETKRQNSIANIWNDRDLCPVARAPRTREIHFSLCSRTVSSRAVLSVSAGAFALDFSVQRCESGLRATWQTSLRDCWEPIEHGSKSSASFTWSTASVQTIRSNSFQVNVFFVSSPLIENLGIHFGAFTLCYGDRRNRASIDSNWSNSTRPKVNFNSGTHYSNEVADRRQ